MSRQKGQSAVELAFILPIFFTMVFGMIYGGMMFMDYLSLNNSAYVAARDISLAATETEQLEIKNKFENKNPDYVRQLTNLYSATPRVIRIEPDVKVEIELDLNEEIFPKLLSALNFPPKKLKSIEIVMPLESKNEGE